MKPLDPDLESLLREWVEKADADLEAADKLAAEMVPGDELRAIEIARFAKAVVLRVLDEDSFAASLSDHGVSRE